VGESVRLSLRLLVYLLNESSYFNETGYDQSLAGTDDANDIEKVIGSMMVKVSQ